MILKIKMEKTKLLRYTVCSPNNTKNSETIPKMICQV